MAMMVMMDYINDDYDVGEHIDDGDDDDDDGEYDDEYDDIVYYQPTIHLYSSIPRDHQSTALLYPLRLSISGACKDIYI